MGTNLRGKEHLVLIKEKRKRCPKGIVVASMIQQGQEAAYKKEGTKALRLVVRGVSRKSKGSEERGGKVSVDDLVENHENAL